MVCLSILRNMFSLTVFYGNNFILHITSRSNSLKFKYIFCHKKEKLTASLFQLCLAFAFRNIKQSTILVKHDYVPEIGHKIEFNTTSAISPIVKLFYP